MISRHAIGAARKDGGLDPWVRLGRFSAKFKEHNYLFFCHLDGPATPPRVREACAVAEDRMQP